MASQEKHISRIPRKTPINPLCHTQTRMSTMSMVTGTAGRHNKTGTQNVYIATTGLPRVDNVNQPQIPAHNIHPRWIKRSCESQSVTINEENAVIRNSVQKLEEDRQRMVKILDGTIKAAEVKMDYMKELITSNEIHSVNKYELPGFGTEEASIESNVLDKCQKISKIKLKTIKDKLQEMNAKTQSYLDDVQIIKKELDDLEKMSLRITPLDKNDEALEDVWQISNSRKTDLPRTSETFFLTERQ